jgi:hypothetical protein
MLGITESSSIHDWNESTRIKAYDKEDKQIHKT